jgi:hypothetical protein
MFPLIWSLLRPYRSSSVDAVEEFALHGRSKKIFRKRESLEKSTKSAKLSNTAGKKKRS